MSRKLATHVHAHVTDGDGNVVSSHVFGPDDKVPAWAVDQLGDHVWEGPGDDEPEVASSPAPPRAGAGSSREAWAIYAADHGVTVEDDASRDRIIEAFDAASGT